jgi:chlorite dismutase
MTDYAAVLSAIRPGAEWSLNANDFATLAWYSDSPKPTKKTLDDAWPQVDYDNQYAAVESARRARYQAETDGLFFAAQRDGEQLDAWKAAVDQIKADLPYPTAP